MERRVAQARVTLHDWSSFDEFLLYGAYIVTLTGAWGAVLFS